MTTTPESEDRTSLRARGVAESTDSGPEPHRDDPRSHDIARRLEAIVDTIQEFAVLRFDARAQVSDVGDIVDAVAAGVNFLGEELEASYEEIERKIANRTAELEFITHELTRRTLHDELTGLPNRTLFWDRLSHRMRLANRRHAAYAIIFVDLDKFKETNDTLGHRIGDQLLVEVAARIRGTLRVGDSAARIGGDEFLVLLDDVASPEAVMIIASRLNAALREPYELGDGQRVVTASLGTVMSSDEFEDAGAVIAAADNAMYEAKQRGRGQCVLYRGTRQT
ncbi:MAG TPA: GGDEF domain-containing protein [Acidimicrobiales bacterium]|nr:GGDEF domain-containing protein [Acidimicrobiales bacterium]